MNRYYLPRSLALTLLVSLCLLSSLPLRAGIEIVAAPHVQATIDSPFRMDCFLVTPQEGFSIRFSGGSPSLPLKKYSHTAAEAQIVEGAIWEGGAWKVSNPELNCGYIVEKAEGLPEYYWIADYRSAPLPQGELLATYASSAPCEMVELSIEGGFTTWSYYRPDGTEEKIVREFLVSYRDLRFSDEDFSFGPIEKKESLPLEGSVLSLLAPLADTSFELLGDQYSPTFEADFSAIESNWLPAQRLEVYTRYRRSSLEGEPPSPEEDEIANEVSAPFKITMEAIANEPAAQRYVWRILSQGGDKENRAPEMIYTGEKCEFTFDKAGSFVLFAEVAARNESCVVESERKTLSVGTSRLEVPNAFSPFSSPGINDQFRVAHQSIVSFHGAIFNEWGNKLFEWEDPNEGWDGTFRGKPVSTGVYYYVIQAKGAEGKEYNLNGHINILGQEAMDLPSSHPQ